MVLGDTDKIEVLETTKDDRFKQLYDRNIDVLIAFDTHTIEREVHEVRELNASTHMRTWTLC